MDTQPFSLVYWCHINLWNRWISFSVCTVHFWWVNKRITFSSLLQRVSPSLWEKSKTPADCLTYFSLHLTPSQTYVKGLDFCVLKWSKEWKSSSILWQILFYLSCSLKLEFFKANLLVWYIVCSGNWYVCKHTQTTCIGFLS